MFDICRHFYRYISFKIAPLQEDDNYDDSELELSLENDNENTYVPKQKHYITR